MFKAKYDQLADIIPLHSEAYDAGIISLQRLIDVLVTPFFKLALAINHLAEHSARVSYSGSPEEFRYELLTIWAVALRNALAGVAVADSLGVQRFAPLLRNAKRKELVTYLLETSPLQVHFTLPSFP